MNKYIVENGSQVSCWGCALQIWKENAGINHESVVFDGFGASSMMIPHGFEPIQMNAEGQIYIYPYTWVIQTCIS